jgi:hypothetical protein
VVCGREKTRIGREGGDLARFISKEHAKHDFEWALVKKMPFLLTNREFLGRNMGFKEATGDLVVVFKPLLDSTRVDYGANLKVVRAKSTGVVRFKSINNDTQCEVTLVQHMDTGGFVPKRVMVSKTPQVLSGVADMRELFQRDDAVDKVARDELAGVIELEQQVYDNEEKKFIVDVQDKLGGLKEEDFKELESPDHLVKMHSIFKAQSRSAIGRASTVRLPPPIACPPPPFVLTLARR